MHHLPSTVTCALFAAVVVLARIAWGLPPAAHANLDVLREAGCLDARGQVTAFVLHDGDRAVKATIAKGIISFPSALRREGDPAACGQLVSLLLRDKPGLN